jgi:5-methylcytosine-specific restriction protein A
MGFIPLFPVGATVTHQELCSEFKCGNMGGMRRSHATNTLVIISDPTKALYDDKWYGNELHYTGMGKSGDQTLSSQNRTLAESDTNGVDVHLFEVLKPTQYIYHGVVKLCSAPYQETQNDDNGIQRKVWMFPLTIVKQNSAVGDEPFTMYVTTQEKKVKEENRRKKLEAPKKKKRKFNVVNFLFGFFILYFAYTAFNQYMLIDKLNGQIEEKKLLKAEVEQKSAELKQDVDKISDKEALLELVEKFARNQYKMVKPNETIYIDKNRNENKMINGIGFNQ